MTWNYRVLKAGDQFAIHEVHYDDENGRITGYSNLPAYPRGDTFEDLVDDIRRYESAIERPVLHEKDGGVFEMLDKDE